MRPALWSQSLFRARLTEELQHIAEAGNILAVDLAKRLMSLRHSCSAGLIVRRGQRNGFLKTLSQHFDALVPTYCHCNRR